jgi:prophage regulatory protein
MRQRTLKQKQDVLAKALPVKLLRLRDVQARVGFGRTGIYARIAAGTFPKSIPIAMKSDGRPSIVGWIESEIDSWIKTRIAEARERPGPSPKRAATKNAAQPAS